MQRADVIDAAVLAAMSVPTISELFIEVALSWRFASRLSRAVWPKLLHLVLLAAESLHHLDRAEPFLRDGEHRALALLDGRRLLADALREEYITHIMNGTTASESSASCESNCHITTKVVTRMTMMENENRPCCKRPGSPANRRPRGNCESALRR